MPNPKASPSTQSYRKTIRSGDTTETFFTSTRNPGVQAPSRGGGGAKVSSGGVGNPVELFIVGSLFIWLVVSGKLKAIIIAGKS